MDTPKIFITSLSWVDSLIRRGELFKKKKKKKKRRVRARKEEEENEGEEGKIKRNRTKVEPLAPRRADQDLLQF